MRTPGGNPASAEQETEHAHFATAERKRFERLRALLALRNGHAVHQLAEGGYLVAWRSWTRECRDLSELEAFAAQVGAL